jgi:plasmid stabilization system protein ParE
MAYKLIWSPASRDDLRDIVSFIARDSRLRAEAFGYRLVSETDKLQNFPEIGRFVPEYGLPNHSRDHCSILPNCLPRRSQAEAGGDRANLACS